MNATQTDIPHSLLTRTAIQGTPTHPLRGNARTMKAAKALQDARLIKVFRRGPAVYVVADRHAAEEAKHADHELYINDNLTLAIA